MILHWQQFDGVAAFLLGPQATHGQEDENRIRDVLERVLQQPEFNQSADGLQAFWRWFRDLLSWIGRLSSDNPGLFLLVLVVCVALLILLGTHVIWTVSQILRAAPPGSRPENLGTRRERLSAHFREQADLLAESRDYTGAIRCLFLSLAHAFDESGRLVFRTALTNREYLQYFSDKPDAQEFLGFFVDLLDKNWYGCQPTERADYAHGLALYDKLRTRS